MAEQKRVEHIAGRIADGESVDWETELAGGGSSVLRNLQLLQGLSLSLNEQAANQDEAALLRHLDQTFDQWLKDHAGGEEPEIPDRWGRLRIEGLHGSGAYADVYRAQDPLLKREVALKLFRCRDKVLQQRLLEEGRRLARVAEQRRGRSVRAYAARCRQRSPPGRRPRWKIAARATSGSWSAVARRRGSTPRSSRSAPRARTAKTFPRAMTSSTGSSWRYPAASTGT